MYRKRKSGVFLWVLMVLLFLCLTGGFLLKFFEERTKENPFPVMAPVQSLYVFEARNVGTFAYDRLSEAEQLWYREINDMLSGYVTEAVKLSDEGLEKGLLPEQIDKIYQSVLMDHPEYFFVDGYEYSVFSRGEKVVGIEMFPKYLYSVEESLKRRKLIEERVEEILLNAPDTEDDYEKVKYVYETLIEQTQYDVEAPDNQNIYSVFVGKSSVCQGYAKATQYLLQAMGLECSIVSGKVIQGELHSWNIVKSNGEYYYLDTTWGDASYSREGQVAIDGNVPTISYDYLCVTTEMIENTHERMDWIEVPVCNTLMDNYFVREGRYFYEYDEEQLKRIFEEVLAAGDELVTIKCHDEAIYNKFYEELIGNQRIFEFLTSDYQKISYSNAEAQLSMSFWVTN